jgi:anti-sigma factor RsiW
LTCRELVELVTEYLEGSLSRRDRSRFDRHIAGCPNCTAYLAQFRETIRLTGTLRVEDVEPAARDELLETFRSWKSDAA